MTRQLIIYWMWRVMSLVPGGVLLSSYLILNGRKREEARRVRKKVPSGRFMSDLNLVPASFFLTFAQPLLHLHPIPFLFNLKRREWGWRWAEKKWVGESLKKVSTTNRSWAWLPTITSSSLILLPSHSFWRKVRREEDDGHRLRELDEEVNGPPGRYLRLDLFIKVLSLLCPNLTDARDEKGKNEEHMSLDPMIVTARVPTSSLILSREWDRERHFHDQSMIRSWRRYTVVAGEPAVANGGSSAMVLGPATSWSDNRLVPELLSSSSRALTVTIWSWTRHHQPSSPQFSSLDCGDGWNGARVSFLVIWRLSCTN